MAFQVTDIPFNGKLDKDSSYSKVKKGDFVGALNVTSVPIDEHTAKGKQIIPGNKYAFNIPVLQAQVKKYRIYFDSVPPPQVIFETINFILPNGSTFLVATFQNFGNATLAAINAKAAILSAISALPYSLTPNITLGSDYIDLEFDFIKGFEYEITRTYVNPTPPITLLQTTVCLQEAIDITLSGEQHVIGGWDFLNYGMCFTTSQTQLPSDLPIYIDSVIPTLPFTNQFIRLTTSAPHGLVTGQTVSISGLPANTNANGVWTIQATGSNYFDLYASHFTAPVFNQKGTITINIQGYGQIGFFQENINIGTWSYTRLLGSKEWNFVTKKQIDCYSEERVGYYGMYWVDAYNVPRVFYYNGAIMQDGGLNYVDSLNQYAYGSIAQATVLILSGTNFDFNFTNQLQSSGGIKPGNWMYSVNLLTDNFIGTPFTDLSNPINVFSALTTGTAAAIWGDGASDPATSKINQFTVTGLIPGLFKYIQLVGVRQIENSFECKFIRRDVLPDSDTTTLQHTGLEPDEDFDFNQLLTQSESYATARNITSLDKRLVMSNLTTAAKKDFSAWTAQWEHTLLKHTMTAVGNYSNGTANLKFGEYEDPNNVNLYVGYMNNETYRYGAKVRFKDGSISECFWIDDIVFNTSATNNSGVANPNRRIAGLADFNLTDSGNFGAQDVTQCYATYLNFSNINLDFLIDGVKIRDLIDTIFIERVDLAKAGLNEILGCGMGVVYCGGVLVNGSGDVLNINSEFTLISGGSDIFLGYQYNLPQLISLFHPGYGFGFIDPFNTGGGTSTTDCLALSLYYPDVFYGIDPLVFRNGDKIINYGSPWRVAAANNEVNSGKTFNSTYIEYTGNTGNPPVNSNITGLANLGEGQIVNNDPDVGSLGKYITRVVSSSITNTWYCSASPVVAIDKTTPIHNPSLNSGYYSTDYGCYYTQYYRNLGGAVKFGATTTNQYVPTGASIRVQGNSTSPTNIDVFGGDTFTQKTYFKHRYPTASADGFGGGMAFYSQNRINSQMRRKLSTSSASLFPSLAETTWLEDTATEQLYYNKGYSINNPINNDIAFDINRIVINTLWGRTIYSDLKPENSVQDNFRIFLPLNFHDSDNNNGAIVASFVKNGELITLQNRSMTREFFNTRGIMETQTQNTSIVIGDGSVMARDGVRITSYGSRHKWSLLHGKSRSGDDIYAWIDTESMTVNHIGGDGTLVVSYLENMQSYFKNALKWVSQYDTPADMFGICGYYDDQLKEFVWTIRAQRNVAVFDPSNTPNVGDVALFPTSFSTYEQIPDIKQWDGSQWVLIPHTNPDYYTEVTICFNEYKNPETFGFTTEYSFLPKIYLKRGDKILSPAPISDEGNVYVHLEGNYGQWYSNNPTTNYPQGKVEDGYIDLIFNDDQKLIKRYLAVLFDSEIAPYKVDFTTTNNFSSLLSGDFTFESEQYRSDIKDDTNPPPQPYFDPANITGQYVIIRCWFKALTYQNISTIGMKFSAMVRTYNK